MSKKSKASGKAYDTGYGKPPKSGQFKSGQSGNPKGRPKKSTDWHDIARGVFFEKISIRINGKMKKVPAIEAYFIQLRQKALEGEAKAVNQVIRLLPFLKFAEASAGEGLSPDQIAELDKEILADFLGANDPAPSNPLPAPRKRVRKKPQ